MFDTQNAVLAFMRQIHNNLGESGSLVYGYTQRIVKNAEVAYIDIKSIKDRARKLIPRNIRDFKTGISQLKISNLKPNIHWFRKTYEKCDY